MGTHVWARSWGAVAEEPADSPLPSQYLVSIPLRMFRLWAFTGMMAQVSPEASSPALSRAWDSQPVVTIVS